MMTDQQKWRRAIVTVTREFHGLPVVERTRVSSCAQEIKTCKRSLFELSEKAEGGVACLSCQGECCAGGKYHFSVIDLLVFLADGRELFTPRFGGDGCPFMGEGGCMMLPEFRPLPCITFCCELIEGQLSSLDRSRFQALTEHLRLLYAELEQLFRTRLAGSLLLTHDRLSESGAPGILQTTN